MKLLIALLILVAPSFACAQFTGNAMPPKPAAVITPNVPSPSRQAGDTIETATVIPSLPFNDTGTTTGFDDDYDEACPFTSTSPDVVYAFTPVVTGPIVIDLCGSSYDTKLYSTTPPLARCLQRGRIWE